MQRTSKARRATRTAAAALAAAALASSCVTQQEYEHSKDLARTYQMQLHEAQAVAAELEQENERLRSQLREGQVSALTDAAARGSVDAEVAQLRDMIANLDRPPGAVERFDVEGGYVFMIQDKVLFPSGSAEVTDEGRRELMKLAGDIQSAAHGQVVVRGHTDSDPVVRPETVARFPHGNLQLSAARAVSVAALLIEQGKVAARDVVVAGYGQWLPVAGNDTADGKRLNRRVEIFVADPGPGQ